MRAELLDVYRAAILRMQQQLRRMPSVSMASLNFSLQEFKACALPHPIRVAPPLTIERSGPHLLADHYHIRKAQEPMQACMLWSRIRMMLTVPSRDACMLVCKGLVAFLTNCAV